MPQRHSDQSPHRRRFVRNSVCFLAVLLSCLLADSSDQLPHLVFSSHKIGEDWNSQASRWMNFVSISSDGLTVASNGNVPGSKGDELGLWTFPAGNYLRRIAGHGGPLALSTDFRYFATETSVLDLQTGRSVLKISPPDRLASAAFSPGGEYVALTNGQIVRNGKPAQIFVLRTGDASVVSSFCTRYTGSLAFHPDGHTLASGHWNNVTLWDARTGERLALLIGVERPVDVSGYRRNGRY